MGQVQVLNLGLTTLPQKRRWAW